MTEKTKQTKQTSRRKGRGREARRKDRANSSNANVTKSRRLHPDRVEYKKYDPVIRKHVLFKEAK